MRSQAQFSEEPKTLSDFFSSIQALVDSFTGNYAGGTWRCPVELVEVRAS